MKARSIPTVAGLALAASSGAVWAADAVAAAQKQPLNMTAIGMFFVFVLATMGITYWAASDASGDGFIRLMDGALSGPYTRVTSNNGNIVMGGGNGASAADGYARGSSGVNLASSSNLQAGTGNITIQGTGNTSGGYGVTIGKAVINGSSISITGHGWSNTSTGSTGVYLNEATISAPNSVSITGVGGGTDVATTLNYTAVAGDQGKYLYYIVTTYSSERKNKGNDD